MQLEINAYSNNRLDYASWTPLQQSCPAPFCGCAHLSLFAFLSFSLSRLGIFSFCLSMMGKLNSPLEIGTRQHRVVSAYYKGDEFQTLCDLKGICVSL